MGASSVEARHFGLDDKIAARAEELGLGGDCCKRKRGGKPPHSQVAWEPGRGDWAGMEDGRGIAFGGDCCKRKSGGKPPHSKDMETRLKLNLYWRICLV